MKFRGFHKRLFNLLGPLTQRPDAVVKPGFAILRHRGKKKKGKLKFGQIDPIYIYIYFKITTM